MFKDTVQKVEHSKHECVCSGAYSLGGEHFIDGVVVLLSQDG